MSSVRLLVVGAGGRGSGFARYAEKYPEKAKVVGVAEPRDHYRSSMVATHSVSDQFVFKDWREAAVMERFADGVLICTQDNMHLEPAIAFAAERSRKSGTVVPVGG